MNILLIGATGMIGSRILSEAVSRGHHVTAAARNPQTIEPQADIVPVALDIEDSEAVSALARRADVVISAVSPRSSGDALRDAARSTVSLVAAGRDSGTRVIMVGGAASLHMPDGTAVLDHLPDALRPEALGMRRAYGTLVAEDIDFVVLAPGGMIEPGARTGDFRTAGRQILTTPEGGMSRISAEDFAIAVLDEATTPQHFRTIRNIGY